MYCCALHHTLTDSVCCTMGCDKRRLKLLTNEGKMFTENNISLQNSRRFIWYSGPLADQVKGTISRDLMQYQNCESGYYNYRVSPGIWPRPRQEYHRDAGQISESSQNLQDICVVSFAMYVNAWCNAQEYIFHVERMTVDMLAWLAGVFVLRLTKMQISSILVNILFNQLGIVFCNVPFLTFIHVANAYIDAIWHTVSTMKYMDYINDRFNPYIYIYISL